MVKQSWWILAAWLIALAVVATHTHDECDDDHCDDGDHDDAPCLICDVAHAPAIGPSAPLAVQATVSPIVGIRTPKPTPVAPRVVFRVTARGPPISG